MPLDTSIYSLAFLRVDGRRWNELRRFSGQIRTQKASDGSSTLDMGLTRVMCIVNGPKEPTKRGGKGDQTKDASIDVNIVLAGFSTVEHRRHGRNDRRIQELEITISEAFSAVVHTHLFPMSQISITLYVLHQDGSLLAALINATTLALVDAGIPMSDYITACTAGLTTFHAAGDEKADPLLDVNKQEEDELPFLTAATLGASDKVVVLVGDTRVQISRLEGMLACAVDGCKQMREKLDGIIREQGHRMITDGAAERSAALEDAMEA